MPLIDVRKLTKIDLDNAIKGVTNEIERYMARWGFFNASIAGLTEADLTALGYDAPTQQLLADFRVGLGNIVGPYHNQAKVGTKDPSAAVRVLTDLLVF